MDNDTILQNFKDKQNNNLQLHVLESDKVVSANKSVAADTLPC